MTRRAMGDYSHSGGGVGLSLRRSSSILCGCCMSAVNAGVFGVVNVGRDGSLGPTESAPLPGVMSTISDDGVKL